jgi:hypothetical protein
MILKIKYDLKKTKTLKQLGGEEEEEGEEEGDL